MSRISILVEVTQSVPEAFSAFESATSASEAVRQSEGFMDRLAGLGLELGGDNPPIPLFAEPQIQSFAAFATLEVSPDSTATSVVINCELDRSRLADLESRSGVRVWPNSTMEAFGSSQSCRCGSSFFDQEAVVNIDESNFHPFDLAQTASSRVDCRPFRPAVSIEAIRQLLAVERIWQDGFRGQNIVVAIVDEGVNNYYPVIGGYERPGGPRPGTASIQSHGSMCAADVLVAAPFAKLLDYPFLAGPNAGDSGVAIQMFQAILDQRRLNGTPHLTTNSYGFYGLPPRDRFPNHEAYDPSHPLNRKVREVIASGAACFFAAGNCGQDCPAGNCQSSAIGPNKSIAAANSLPETITVAAVNSQHERIGYSAQGPGTLFDKKPELSAYSHFYGNYGPGRPAGGNRFDNGTSAACPVAAGVGALLLSAFLNLSPDELRQVLTETAINLQQPGWDTDTGWGVLNAAAAYLILSRR